MNAADFREWRQRVGLTQAEAGTKFNVTRGTIQNWENAVSKIPLAVEASCQIMEDRHRQKCPDLGPVTLIYTDGPMFINPYGPRARLAMMKQEVYETNAKALARVLTLWTGDGFHNPLILEDSERFLWNSAQLRRVIDGEDADAPLWRKVTVAKASREESVAVDSANRLIEACGKAYRAKGLPKEVRVLRDKSTMDDYVFYFSPAAFALTPREIRAIADSIAYCDAPNPSSDLKEIEL